MHLSEFDFDFPQDQIAMNPAPRGESRMMVIEKKTGQCLEHSRSGDLPRFLKPGDALVINDTKVIPARLFGKTNEGARVEILLTALPETSGLCKAMVKPGRKFKPGREIQFDFGLFARVLERSEDGLAVLQLDCNSGTVLDAIEKAGNMPLPPYIKREAEPGDRQAYQTVFAENPGAVAAPTASLHFAKSHLDEIKNKGISLVKVTLHVGLGTFKPVQTEQIENHQMHSESFTISQDSANKLNHIKTSGGHIWALGTTSARVLESVYNRQTKSFIAGSGKTGLYITPGYEWKAVDGLLTNFHWPRSTLFILVCSLIGKEHARARYAEAIKMGYRLFSFGDAMLIAP